MGVHEDLKAPRNAAMVSAAVFSPTRQMIRPSLAPTIICIGGLILLLTACVDLPKSDGPPHKPIDVATIPDAVPRFEPLSRYGNPPSYVVNGERYFTQISSRGYSDRGIASWYGTKFHGRRTSSGEPYDMYQMTAAHRTLPLPCYVEVTNLANDRRVVVRVNDRGPFHSERVLDLSYAAAAKLGIVETGTAQVSVRTVVPKPANSSAVHQDGQSVNTARRLPPLYVQAGAFRSLANAEHLKLRLRSHVGITAGLSKVSQASGNLFRVRIGPIETVAEAERLAAKLAAAGVSKPRIIEEH
ncbi:MAG: septal ring lytic transglycosylase RlpA family protein [Gammaproteobacteria bacterium]|jgi:rare lipoprotein A